MTEVAKLRQKNANQIAATIVENDEGLNSWLPITAEERAGELRGCVERRKLLPTYYNSARKLTPYQMACVAVKQRYPFGIRDEREIPEMVELVAGILGVEV